MKSTVVTQPKPSTEDSFHVVELDDVADALKIAAKLEYGGLPGAVLGDSTVRVAELKAQLAALESEIVAAYDASGDWQVSGYRTVGAALTHRARIRRAEANQTVHLARSLKAMPVVSDALGGGEIGLCHARRLAKASARDGFSDVEALLCDHARGLSYAAFDKAVSYWEHLVDTNAAEHDATFKEQRREFHASMTFDGMGRLDGWLDPISFEEFRSALDRIEAELFNSDLGFRCTELIGRSLLIRDRQPCPMLLEKTQNPSREVRRNPQPTMSISPSPFNGRSTMTSPGSTGIVFYLTPRCLAERLRFISGTWKASRLRLRIRLLT